jgi:very-short-patch-repair endonuclease
MAAGYQVLRFTNEQVFQDMPGVLEVLRRHLENK